MWTPLASIREPVGNKNNAANVLYMIRPYFILQQYLWNIATQPAVGCSVYKLIYVIRAAHR